MKKEVTKAAVRRGLATVTRRALLLAAPVLASIAGASCLAGPAQAADTPLVIARAMDINSLDPARTWCDTCQIYVSNVYESLIGLGPDNKTLTPRLATKWESNADQTQFTFHLDPDAVFSDGSPVEGKDVKWSWERLHNIKGGPSFMMDGVKSIEAPDAHTVVVTMEAPNSEFLGILTAPYTGAINSDVAMANGANANPDADKSDTSEPWFMANSAGSGPYMLAGYKADDELRFKANPNYKRSKVGVAEVVIKHTKDAVSQAQLLESGSADVAMQIDPDTAKTIKSDSVVIETVPSYNFVYVAVSPGAKGNTVKLTKEVRQAIGYALDYNGTVEFTVGGQGKLQSAPIPNGFPGTDNLPMPTQDIAKAKELLQKAGLGSGFEIKAEFPNMNVYGVDLSMLMQKVQQDLAQVNIKVGLTPLEFSVWRDHVRGDGIPLTAVFYAPDYFGSAQYIQYFAMMEGTPWWKRAGGPNDPSVTNAKEGDLLKQALAAPEAEKDKFFHDIALEMISDRVIIPLVSPNVVLAHGKTVKGVRYSACCNLPLDEITRE
jgi:peptide/nickel transport system substrate-binding protein